MHIQSAVKLLLLALLLALAGPAQAGTVAGRCRQYAEEVRQEHFRQFGVDYPWHYALGQLQQESGCRNVVSLDGIGSAGVSQVTWSFWGPHLVKAGIPDLATSRHQIRAQALINRDAWDQAHPKRLWIGFQIYNGGRLVLKEIAAAGVADWAAARAKCRRRVVVFKSGQRLDACEINYDYSQKLAAYGAQYRIGPDAPKFVYW